MKTKQASVKKKPATPVLTNVSLSFRHEKKLEARAHGGRRRVFVPTVIVPRKAGLPAKGGGGP